MENSEARMQELEGVLFGMGQAVALLIANHPSPDRLRMEAREKAEGMLAVALNSGLDDFAVSQANSTFRTLFGLPQPT